MRTIKAIFEIQEDSYNAGVRFKVGNKTIHWDALSCKEQEKMLGAWAAHYNLFNRFLKEEDDETGDS